MTAVRLLAGAAAVPLACGLLMACGPQRLDPPPTPPPSDLILLLPDSDGGTGRASVTGSGTSVELSSAREFTRVSAGQPPTPAAVMSAADVQRQFGDVLATLPPPAVHFVLYFQFESNELTPESQLLLPQVLDAIRNRTAALVAVIGHTDTTGTSAGNFQLGLTRARVIHDLLVGQGVSAAVIDVTSHGEGDPLVPTADEVREPRNRRVEITIR
jgi:outer membrane protein OmpA-like peptidoglycan-associated protein